MCERNFDDIVQEVLTDPRVKDIPVLFVIQMIIVLEDLDII